MTTPAKAGVGVLVAAAIGLCVWSVTRTLGPEPVPKTVLEWKCSKCEATFDAEPGERPGESFGEGDAPPPQTPCPTCGGAAYRLVDYRCTKCGHRFERWLTPAPDTGGPPAPACPKCSDPRVAPVQALGKH